MSDRSEFTLDLDAVQIAPTPFGQNVAGRKSIRRTLLQGDGTDQLRVLYVTEFLLGAGATAAVDLRLLNDRYGANLLLDDLCILFLENEVNVLGGGNLELRPSAANGFTNLLGVGSALKLAPGSFVCLGNFTALQIAITGVNKSLDLVETGAVLPVAVRLHVWGRR